MCDQRTREPATSEQRIGQGSLTAKRAISACISESAFLAYFILSKPFGAEQVFNAQFLTDLFCSILHPYKGMEWSGAEKDPFLAPMEQLGAAWSSGARHAHFLRISTFGQFYHPVFDEQVIFCR